MSKLIFAASSSIIEQQMPGVIGTSQQEGYYSIAVTDDGYFYTHGQKFRLYKVVNNLVSGLTLGWSPTNGNLLLLDGGVLLAAVNAVGTILGDSIITATRDSSDSKKYTITHKQPTGLADGAYGGATDLDAINMPTLTVDAYGHVTAISNTVVDASKVKGAAFNLEADNYYLIGVKDATVQKPLYNTNIYIDKSGNFHATNIYEGSTLISNKYAAKQTATNAVEGTVLLSDAIDSDLNAASGGTAATPYAVKASLAAAKQYAQDLFSENDALVFIGTINASGVFQSHNALIVPTVIDGTTSISASGFAYKAGYTMKFTQAGALTLGATGYQVTFNVEPGDVLLCINDKGTEYKGSDFTVIQNNIDGQLVSTAALTGVLYGTGSRTISALANPVDGDGYLKWDATNEALTWVAKSTLWRTFYKGNSSGDSILNKNIILKSSTGTSTTDPLVITFGTEGNDATITYTINPKAILTNAALTLTIMLGNNQFAYDTSADKVLNIGSGLTLDVSNDVWTLKHPTNYAISTSKLGAITTDSYGHVTSFSEVTSLPNPGFLYIGTDGTVINSVYSGSANVGYNFVADTDVTLTPTLRTTADGLVYEPGNRTAGVDIKIGITHKYRPISILKRNENSYVETSILATATSNTLKLREGTHVTLTNGDAGIVDIASSWRDVLVYTVTGSNLVQGQLGDTSALIFSQDFIVQNNELGLYWTEIDANGNISYVN